MRIKLLIVLIFGLFMFSGVAKAESRICVLEPIKDYTTEFYGYVIKNDDLYINIRMWSNTDNKEENVVYKFNKEKQVCEKLNNVDTEWYFNNRLEYPIYKLDEDPNYKFIINKDTYFILKEGPIMNSYKIILYKKGKEINKFKGYDCTFKYNDYLYVDTSAGKIYFPGFTIGANPKYGIYIYDVVNEKISNFIVKEKNDDEPVLRQGQPIRVPNTVYMMYVEDFVDFKKFKNIKDIRGIDVKSFKIWIQEIPEWKAELEAKNKENDIEVSANAEEKQEIKYIIDGPANIREKAKGKKVIGSIEDKAEVKILNKKGDWYEVESGEIKGWTFKDNVKEVK